ncbi:MAG: PDZ domain-containing protein [Actinobacteria bacterium]|nr:PDZ domain-containing protein [Actinomycetota bacterium]
MPYPSVLRVSSGSPAERAGVLAGDALVAVNGVPPRDIIESSNSTTGSTASSRGGSSS